MLHRHSALKRSTVFNICYVWLAILLAYSPYGVLGTAVCKANEKARQWTIYLAQDKHLDYNWCGSTTEIELRIAALLDYFLDTAG